MHFFFIFLEKLHVYCLKVRTDDSAVCICQLIFSTIVILFMNRRCIVDEVFVLIRISSRVSWGQGIYISAFSFSSSFWHGCTDCDAVQKHD